MDLPLNLINVTHAAAQRGIQVRTTTVEQEAGAAPQLSLEIKGPPGATDAHTVGGDQTRRIVGRVYQDMRPRVVEINHYFMDMVPAGDMVLIQNEDRPGMIGTMGTEFGQAKVNIADMAISRREADGGATAFCVLKVDDTPPESLLSRLRRQPGFLKVATVKLPPEKKA
jgi:D-3-phosphoglycerate dehydrogenase